MAYLVAWLFPATIVAPSTYVLPLAGALTIPRFFLFLASFATARELWRKLTTGGFVLIASDLLVPATTLWMLATLLIHHGAKGLVGFGAVNAIEFTLAYFLARVFFGTVSGYMQFVRVMRVVVALVLVTALMDTLSGQNLVSRIGWSLSGGLPAETFPMRFGLVRAQGSIEHPILLGLFFVVSSILFFHSTFPTREKAIWISVCVFGALLPLSSAPILSLTITLAVGVFLTAFERFPWRSIVIVLGAAYALAIFFAVVDDPLPTLIRNFTFDPQTGLFRIQIWEWAAVNIQRAPWSGIGFDDWMRSEEMPPSMDSLYLIQAVRHGLPALALLALSMLSTGVTMPLRAQVRYFDPTISMIRSGMALAIVIYCFNAFTVHLWGANWTLLAVVLGIRAGLTESIYMTPTSRADSHLLPTNPIGRRNRS